MPQALILPSCRLLRQHIRKTASQAEERRGILRERVQPVLALFTAVAKGETCFPRGYVSRSDFHPNRHALEFPLREFPARAKLISVIDLRADARLTKGGIEFGACFACCHLLLVLFVYGDENHLNRG